MRGNHDVVANMNGRKIGRESTPTSDGREVANRDRPAFPGIESASTPEPHAISQRDRSSMLIANEAGVVAYKNLAAQVQIVMLHQGGRRHISEFSQLGNALLFVVVDRARVPTLPGAWRFGQRRSDWHIASTRWAHRSANRSAASVIDMAFPPSAR